MVFGNALSGPIPSKCLRKVAVGPFDLAVPKSSPVAMPIVAFSCKRQDSVEAWPSFTKGAAPQLNPSHPELTEYIARIEFGGFQIAIERPLGIGETRDGAQVAPRCRREF